MIDIQLQLRGPLAYRLLLAAAQNGEEPVTLLARSVQRMIENNALDIAENNRPPQLFDIENYWIACAALKTAEGKVP